MVGWESVGMDRRAVSRGLRIVSWRSVGVSGNWERGWVTCLRMAGWECRIGALESFSGLFGRSICGGSSRGIVKLALIGSENIQYALLFPNKL